MASHPTYDPNKLDEQASALLKDPQSPLLDRAAQEAYPPGSGMQSWLQAIGFSSLPSINSPSRLYQALGFYTTPDLHLPVASAVSPDKPLRLSPLQVILAAATLGNHGIRPAPRLAMAVKTPTQGWVVLPPLSDPVKVLSDASGFSATQALMVKNQPFWQWSGSAGQGNKTVSWALAGTSSDWKGTPLVIVVLLEDPSQQWAAYLDQQLLEAAIQP